jgi:Spy/CpxP family protein refolding chaperone
MAMRKKFIFSALFCLVASGLAFGQAPGGPGGPGGDGHGWGRPPMERTFHDGQFGRWWENPKIAQAIGLTDDEKKKMDDIYQQHKLKLIDLHANLEKAEVQMGPMIEADQPDETQVLAQIDKVAQARAELEKGDARMLFDIRKTLTPDQWKKLKTLHQQHRADMMSRDRDGRDGQGGPGQWHHHRQGPPPDGAGQPPPSGQAPPQGDAQDVAPPAPGDGAPAGPTPQM